MGIKIGVVGMKQCPVADAQGQIGGMAAAGVEGHVHRRQAPLGVMAVVVGDQNVVALAGHDHIVITVQADLHRPPGDVGAEGGQTGPLRGLAFLAAEPTPHAPAFANHRRFGQPQHGRHQVLHLGWMLGRGMHMHLAAVAG